MCIRDSSSVPALLGRKSLRTQRSILDCYNNLMYTIGPGGYKLQLSPGSKEYKLEESHAGHLMLPCDEFREADQIRKTSTTRATVLATSMVESTPKSAMKKPTEEATAKTQSAKTSSRSTASGSTTGTEADQPREAAGQQN